MVRFNLNTFSFFDKEYFTGYVVYFTWKYVKMHLVPNGAVIDGKISVDSSNFHTS